ncbi:MAG: T9SS type A sorting domain-containing protein [Candidatus Kapaibacterium sp.]
MKKYIYIITFLIPLITLSDTLERVEGINEYSYVNKIFSINNEIYTYELSGNEDVYKFNNNSWIKLDTGFLYNKGTVRHINQKGDVIFASIGRKLYLSYDSGESWKEFETLGGQVSYSSVTIVDTTIFLQANEFFSLYKLEKGVDTLEKIYLDDSKTDSVFADIIISSGNYIFSTDKRKHFDGESKEGTFYISKDKGKTWKFTKSMKKQIDNLHFHNNTLLAFTSEKELYSSTDIGETWTLIPNFEMSVNKMISFNNKIFSCGGSITTSTDNGLTWEAILTEGLEGSGIKDLLINNDTLFLHSRDNIIYYSTNEGKYWFRNSPLTDDVRQYNITNVNDTLFSTGSYGIYYSVDKGNSWDFYNINSYFAGTRKSRIYKSNSTLVVLNDSRNMLLISTDYGNTWNYNNLGYFEFNTWIDEFLIMGNRFLLFSKKYGTHYSEDFGKTWIKYTDNEIFKDDISNYYPFRLDENNIIINSNKRQINSSDNGLTWSFIEHSENDLIRFVNYSDNILYGLGIDNKILKSTDLGINWVNIDLEISKEESIRHFKVYNDYFLYFSLNKVFVSNKEKTEWNSFQVNDTTPYGDKLYFNSGFINEDYLLVSSEYGIWRAKISDLGIEVKSTVESEIERNYLYTYPPYPNPAKSEVKVLFYWDINIPMTAYDISIYDLSGRKIQTSGNLRLGKEARHKGNIIWDCSTAQPGVYILNIKHGTEEKAVKVVLE